MARGDIEMEGKGVGGRWREIGGGEVEGVGRRDGGNTFISGY